MNVAGSFHTLYSLITLNVVILTILAIRTIRTILAILAILLLEKNHEIFCKENKRGSKGIRGHPIQYRLNSLMPSISLLSLYISCHNGISFLGVLLQVCFCLTLSSYLLPHFIKFILSREWSRKWSKTLTVAAVAFW